MKRFFSKFFLLISVGLPLVVLVLFQNCSDVRLSKLPESNEMASNSAKGVSSHLPVPEILAPNVRIVFFVDQSTSMARQRCPQELDWETVNPDLQRRGDTRNCEFKDGVDVNGNRFALIQKWIESFDIFGVGSGDRKYAIIPFSGGLRQRPNVLQGDADKMIFLERSDALLFNESLYQEHIDDVELMKSNMGATPEFLGTSIPLSVLSYSKDLIQAEMNKLSEASILGNTKFHFIYLSDGVYKPTNEILEKAKEVIGCANCAQNPGHSSCQKSPPSGKTCEYKIGNKRVSGCMWHVCNQHLPALMKDNFGDPEENDYDLIKNEILKIKSLENNFYEVSLKLHFVNLYPEESLKFPWEPGNKAWSIFNHIADDFPEEAFVEYNGGILELELEQAANREVHFAVDNFYAINLNTYLDSFSKQIIDKDSDGVEDKLELSKGFDPNKARSNDVCLDIITDKFGCDPAITQACFAHFDFDGDGLNQCEEQILQTNEKSADSDGDGVLDSHEVLRGLNPNKDDNADLLSLDSINAMDHFKKGAHPLVDLNRVIKNQLIDLRISRKGYEHYPGSFGNEYFSGKYKIEVKNIPSRQVGPFFNSHYLSRDPVKKDKYELDHYLLGTQHDLNKNEILFVLKLRQVQKPDEKIWFIKRYNVDALTDEVIHLDIKDFKTLNLIERK